MKFSIAVRKDGRSLQYVWTHLLHANSNHLAFCIQSETLCGQAWTKLLMNGASRPKPRVSRHQEVFKLGLFLYLRPRQVTRQIAIRIGRTSTTPGYRMQKIKPNQKVPIPPQSPNGKLSLHCLDTTHPYQIFWATPRQSCLSIVPLPSGNGHFNPANC